MSEAYKSSLVAARHLIITQRLRERRDELGLTQKQIVTRLARCGLQTTNRALSSLEHGSGLDVAKLPELAMALDCTVTYLIGLTEDAHRWEPDETIALPPRPPAVPGAPARSPLRTDSAPPNRPATSAGPPTAESLILGGYVPSRRLPRRGPDPAG
jgi:transcriptional regulator with XRE-family HTH domain